MTTSLPPAAHPASPPGGPDKPTRRRPSAPSSVSLLVFARDGGMIVLWVLMVLCFSVWAAPTFGTYTNATLVLGAAALTAIFAGGIAFGVLCGFIDMSVPGTAAFSAVVAGKILVGGQPVWVAVLAGTGVGALVGVVNGLIVLRGLNPLVVTIGSLSVLTGLASVVSTGVPVDGLSALHGIGTDSYWGIPAPVYVAALVFVLGTGFVTQTRHGARMVAVGGNPDAVRRAGVNSSGYIILAFVLVGICSAIGGIVTAAVVTSATPAVAPSVLFDALTAVALSGMPLTGGRGSFPRVLVGALIIATISSALVIQDVQPYWATATSGMLLISALGVERALGHAIAGRLVTKDAVPTRNPDPEEVTA
jgi:ribose transport system permease protein